MKSLPILIGPITTNINTFPRLSGTCEALYVDSQVVCLMSVAQKKNRWVTIVAKIATHLKLLPKLPYFATTLPKTRCLGLRLCHQSNRPLGSSLLSKAPLPNHLHHRQARSFAYQPKLKDVSLVKLCLPTQTLQLEKMFLLWSCARRLVSLVSSERLQCHVWGRNPVQNQVTIPFSGQSVKQSSSFFTIIHRSQLIILFSDRARILPQGPEATLARGRKERNFLAQHLLNVVSGGFENINVISGAWF